MFEQAHAGDAEAREAGIVVCPGVGFDVIPTDCLAACLKEALPDAQRLALGFDTGSGLSTGTAKTSVEGPSSAARSARMAACATCPWATSAATSISAAACGTP